MAEFTSDKVKSKISKEISAKKVVVMDTATVTKDNVTLAILCLSIEENLKSTI